MLTRQHTQESLSKAFAYAVGGRAGVNVSCNRAYDYGIDGTFHPVVARNNRLVESGFPVDFQLKSTVNWTMDGDHVVYDLESKTYNDLVARAPEADRCILILLCLPRDESLWLTSTETDTVLQHCCYWTILEGQETPNAETQRIRIPRENLLTAEALTVILNNERARRMGS